jgi:hypothetical protein
MPHTITIEEQERLGLRDPKPANYVVPYAQHEITAHEQGVIDSALSAAGTVMSDRQMSHLAKSDDTALTNAFASLFYSLAYSVAGALISGGILLLAYSVLGGDEGLYALLFLILWGGCFLAALAYNRWQGLWFSPAGLEHHEIESRERIAMHAIDKHIELIERRWGVKA